jgi:hypothetical protein
MNDASVLFLLRLLSAIILLGFLAALAVVVYRDLQRSALESAGEERIQGHLRVVASESETAGVGTIYPLLLVTSIGRSESNTIVLEDGFVSAEHALITRRERQWWLEDLDSRNGTLLNAVPVEEATVVSAGDILTVGSVQMKLEPAIVQSQQVGPTNAGHARGEG